MYIHSNRANGKAFRVVCVWPKCHTHKWRPRHYMWAYIPLCMLDGDVTNIPNKLQASCLALHTISVL